MEEKRTRISKDYCYRTRSVFLEIIPLTSINYYSSGKDNPRTRINFQPACTRSV